MAKAAGISLRSVQCIWAAHDLQSHRVRTFKRSRDPRFADKLVDIVGLYLDPPAHGVVLSIDEKSQIRALDRTQPGLPLKPGRCGTMTHDYKRHGTTRLFAALNVLDGTVIGRCIRAKSASATSDPSCTHVMAGSRRANYNHAAGANGRLILQDSTIQIAPALQIPILATVKNR